MPNSDAAPQLCSGNQGITTAGSVQFTRGQDQWTETFNVVELLSITLAKYGYPVEQHQKWLVHPESGLHITPQIMDLQILDHGDINTVTTIQVNHPDLLPAGTFEQHSVGETIQRSILSGFDQWVQTDFVVFLAALEKEPQDCPYMMLAFPSEDGKSGHVRRVILGPPLHYTEQSIPGDEISEDEHPFCPCCLLTNSFEAFRAQIESQHTYCIRLFSARFSEEEFGADCRIDGEDYESGKQSLISYAQSWSGSGYEFRKQLVLIQSFVGSFRQRCRGSFFLQGYPQMVGDVR